MGGRITLHVGEGEIHRNELFESGDNITLYGRIGPLVYGQSGSGVRVVDHTEGLTVFGGRDLFCEQRCDVDEFHCPGGLDDARTAFHTDLIFKMSGQSPRECCKSADTIGIFVYGVNDMDCSRLSTG